MSRILLSYDLETSDEGNIHDDVKKYMKGIGYFDEYLGEIGDTLYVIPLPNTCLWHPDTTERQARSDFYLAFMALHYTKEKRLIEKLFITTMLGGLSHTRIDFLRLPTSEDLVNIPRIK